MIGVGCIACCGGDGVGVRVYGVVAVVIWCVMLLVVSVFLIGLRIWCVMLVMVYGVLMLVLLVGSLFAMLSCGIVSVGVGVCVDGVVVGDWDGCVDVVCVFDGVCGVRGVGVGVGGAVMHAILLCCRCW